MEKTGTKLENLLQQSRAWSDLDSRWDDCAICRNTKEGEKIGQCYKRYVLYETYFEICQEAIELKDEEHEMYKNAMNAEETVENENNGQKRKRREMETIEKKKKYDSKDVDHKVKYIEETSISNYEPGL